MGLFCGLFSAGSPDSSNVMSYLYFVHHSNSQKAFSPETQSHAISHLMFALTVGLCSYNFFRAVTLDPGTCPKPTSDDELKSVIFISSSLGTN